MALFSTKALVEAYLESFAFQYEQETARLKPDRPRLTEVYQKRLDLRNFCDTVDELLRAAVNPEELAVDINKVTFDVSILVSCDAVSIDSESHPIFKLLKLAKELTIKRNLDGENIVLRFIIPGIWKRE